MLISLLIGIIHDIVVIPLIPLFFAFDRRLRISKPKRARFLIHVSSLGELNASLPLVERIKEEFDECFFITTFTEAGFEASKKIFKDRTGILPIPLFVMMFAFMLRVRPEVLVLIETELWPALILSAKAVGAKVVVVNGKISKLWFYRLLKPILRLIELVCAQNENFGLKFKKLVKKVVVTGNMKSESKGIVLKEISLRKESKVVCFASVREGVEEEAVVGATAKLHGVKVFIVPRHIKRAEEIGRKLAKLKVEYKMLSEGLDACTVVDEYGVLPLVYKIADVVFVGGTISPFGGHNIIEPCLQGCAVVFGPHTENIEKIAKCLEDEGGGKRVENPEKLAQTILELMNDEEAPEKAKRYAHKFKGAVELNFKAIITLTRRLSRRGLLRNWILNFWYREKTPAPIKLMSKPFEAFYTARRLIFEVGGAPENGTICIGSIALGGSRKTPVSILVARKLKEKGLEPAVVLRGYGEDEEMMYRTYGIEVFKGRRRERLVKEAKEKGFKTVVLDDAFSYLRLRPAVRVLVLSGRDIGNGLVQPFGPLREPLLSLKFANIILAKEGLEVKHPSIFHFKTSCKLEVEGRCVLVSGIAIPESFEEMVKGKVNITRHMVFPDHHRYKSRDIDFILSVAKSSKADFILTTEKDFVKLSRFSLGIPIHVAKMEIEVDEGFFEMLISSVCQC